METILRDSICNFFWIFCQSLPYTQEYWLSDWLINAGSWVSFLISAYYSHDYSEALSWFFNSINNCFNGQLYLSFCCILIQVECASTNAVLNIDSLLNTTSKSHLYHRLQIPTYLIYYEVGDYASKIEESKCNSCLIHHSG